MAKSSVKQLLDEYEIRSAKDFYNWPCRKRETFCHCLRASFDREAERVFPDLKHDRGLKLHLRFTPSQIGEAQRAATGAFLRKCAFFANRTIVTLPIGDTSERNTHFKELLEILCAVRPCMEDNVMNVLLDDTGRRWRGASFEREYGLRSANFRLEDLRFQFEEQGALPEAVQPVRLSPIYMPHFSDIPAEDVILVRQDEHDLYACFEDELTDLLDCPELLENEKKLLDKLKSIDYAVNKLTARYKAMEKAFKKRNLWGTLCLFPVVISAFVPKAIVETLRQFLGSSTVADVFKEGLKEHGDLQALRNEDCYLLWRVAHAHAKV